MSGDQIKGIANIAVRLLVEAFKIPLYSSMCICWGCCLVKCNSQNKQSLASRKWGAGKLKDEGVQLDDRSWGVV